MKFHGKVGGIETSDPREWADIVKANPVHEPYTRAGKPVVVKTANLKTRTEYQFPARVTLTKDEQEWLGRTVRRSDGFVGQVWCLGRAGRKGDAGSLWVVSDGAALEVDISDLMPVES